MPLFDGLCLTVAKGYIMPKAILFDLDDTLTDRMQSVAHYAGRFQRDFTAHLASTTVASILLLLWLPMCGATVRVKRY